MDMRLYIDEVGNSDLRGAVSDPNIRYLSLTGVLAFRNQHDHIIAPRIENLKSILPGYTKESSVILHRREVIRREGIFSALHDPMIKEKFDNELLSILHESPYLAITVQIDKKQHFETYGIWRFDPYHYCLRCLVERFVLYMKRHNKKGDVVIEPRFKKADKKLKISFERIFNNGTDNLDAKLVQKHLISKDIKFFAKNKNIAGLQIADLIAHPSARQMRDERNNEPPRNDFGAQVARILIRRRYARCPKTCQIDGWGTKWLP